jgi:uncharacterized protein YPO0396
MKIAKLITWHWGSLDSREWDFADTVLLTGESGSGKSTLLDAIQTLLTAAHHHLVQFNIGQDESTQSRRGGKEPRTLQAYALGQQADGVFLRKRATSYVALVFTASTNEVDQQNTFTAMVGVEAHEDGGKPLLSKSQFFIVRQALGLSHLLRPAGDMLPAVAWPLKEFYVQLQQHAQVVQRFEDKTNYLTHLYGALMGKTALAEPEAFRSAKSLVKAMAYKELGNVNDLVRDEILDPQDFSKDLDKMRELMRAMAGLKAEAERLQLNIDRLEKVEQSAHHVLAEARRFVLTSIAYGMRVVMEATSELETVDRQITAQNKLNAAAHERLAQLQNTRTLLDEQLRAVEDRLNDNDVAQRKRMLEDDIRRQAEQFRKGWQQIHQAGKAMSSLALSLTQLLGLDLSSMPLLAQAVDALRPSGHATLVAWQAMQTIFLQHDVALNTELPAFDLEAFDADLDRLRQGIQGHDESLASVVSAAMGDLHHQQRQLQDEQTQREAELRALQKGKPPAPTQVMAALDMLQREAPQARAHLLAQLVEPRDTRGDPSWQTAIEGYMGADRFAIIVEAGMEAPCTRLVKRQFPQRSPKVVQGSKAMADTQGRSLEAGAIVHELICTHPVGKAFLMAQYGRVRKVETEDELSRTAQGLMIEGVGSRGYGMFSCAMDERELVFGQASRQRRIAWCEKELSRLDGEIKAMDALKQSLRTVHLLFVGAPFTPFAPLMQEVLTAQLQHADAERTLSALDLSSIAELEKEQQALQVRIQTHQTEHNKEQQAIGAANSKLGELQLRQQALQNRLPGLQEEQLNATVWASRFVQGAPGQATELQLLNEAQVMAEEPDISPDAMRQRISSMNSVLPVSLRELNTQVQSYLVGARHEHERFAFAEPPRGQAHDKLEDILAAVLALLQHVAEQLHRQRAIGLAENKQHLAEGERRFNEVFTSSFCFKVRDQIRQGASTLQKLNRELRNIQFGTDTYALDWDWIPRLQKVYDFFEVVEGLVDTFEKDQVSLFDSPRLGEAHRDTAHEIRKLLLANDQGASERALKELADYRNYRRYDIIRHSPVGQTRLSTWGTGSGGELETPFYVVRSAVLAHALGHFGRERQGAPALRLMLSDEAFSKMDESRSRNVLQFLSCTLGLQLIVAMPTSKSGAVKPEFDKEFTFSKVLATRDGKELFVSEVQEKTFKRDALGALWRRHAEQARAMAKSDYLVAQSVAESDAKVPDV